MTPDPYTRYVHILHLIISLPCWNKLFRQQLTTPLNYTQPSTMLRSRKVHSYIQNSPLLIRILSQTNSVHSIIPTSLSSSLILYSTSLFHSQVSQMVFPSNFAKHSSVPVTLRSTRLCFPFLIAIITC